MKFVLNNIGLTILFLFSIFVPKSFAEYVDGTYDATVTTDSGSYTVPVEVEGGQVTHVDWPNGGHMTVQGADIDDGGAADGTNLREDAVHVELDNPEDAKEQEDNQAADE